ncbi:MAG: glycosyltransferase [Thermoplasmata archaeon]|nr:glycosyltransferase [Thermoplasmata archaeon]
MSDPTLSVVIPTLNSAAGLDRLLRSLRLQSSPADEIVVVDGGSADGTEQVATRFGCVLLHDSGGGDRRSQARNLGAQRARGELLVFLDADMEGTPGMIAACRAAHEQGAHAAIIPEITSGTGLLGWVRAWERNLVHSQRLLVFPRSIRKELFIASGGFDESLSGFEDLDLTGTLIEQRVPVGIVGAAVIHHEEGQTFGTYLARRLQYARGAGIYRSKHPHLAEELFSPLARLRMYLSGIHGLRDLPPCAIAFALRSVEYIRLR